MSRAIEETATHGAVKRPEVLRSYPGPWKGQLLLACRKCQKKLKHGRKKVGISKLSKALKKRARHDENAPRLHVIEVPCLKLCPKGGVTVCTQRQLGQGKCSIVRTNADVDALYKQTKAQHSITFRARPASEVSL
jgi:predicted metal-binding protein